MPTRREFVATTTSALAASALAACGVPVAPGSAPLNKFAASIDTTNSQVDITNA